MLDSRRVLVGTLGTFGAGRKTHLQSRVWHRFDLCFVLDHWPVRFGWLPKRAVDLPNDLAVKGSLAQFCDSATRHVS